MLNEDAGLVLHSLFQCDESADEMSSSPKDSVDDLFSVSHAAACGSCHVHSQQDSIWISKNANWITYRRELDHIISGWCKKEGFSVSIEEQNTRLSHAIMTAALKSIPRLTSRRVVDEEAATTRAELFMDAFVEMSRCDDNDHVRLDHHEEIKQRVLTQLEKKCCCEKCEGFTLDQLRSVLHAARKRNSCGPDGICYDMLRQLTPLAEIAFLHLINCTWQDGVTPSSWRESAIHLNIRRGHPLELLSSYRVIGLSNCMSKCAERLFIQRLRPFLVNCGVLQNSVSRICTNSLYESQNKMMHVAAVDIYDVLERMLYFKIPLCWVKWVSAILCDRRATVYLSAELSSSCKGLFFGLPMGSLLSPLLWALHSYPVSRQLIDRSVSLPSGSVEDITCRMERALSQSNDFTDDSFLVRRFFSMTSVDNSFCNQEHQRYVDEYLQGSQ